MVRGGYGGGYGGAGTGWRVRGWFRWIRGGGLTLCRLSTQLIAMKHLLHEYMLALFLIGTHIRDSSLGGAG